MRMHRLLVLPPCSVAQHAQEPARLQAVLAPSAPDHFWVPVALYAEATLTDALVLHGRLVLSSIHRTLIRMQ